MSQSNMMPGDNSGAEPAEHGCDTSVYQDLTMIEADFELWLEENRKNDLGNDENVAKAEMILKLMHEILEDLYQPI